MNKPELLAPAGNWDCVRAAVANGADAVYFGLDRFNARMRADNFSVDDLGVLMPFLHAHGVRGYVTLNVLIFPDEMQAAAEYIHALESARVDGVIVQDMGLATYVAQQRREGNIRHLELHLSTQMTLTCPEAVQLVDEMFDPQQIVLARELSLREIEACAKATRKPIEVFCHGALCVAYSGQCLTSESLGQRSANRGECVQICRRKYDVTDVETGNELEVDNKYIMSPKDLKTIRFIDKMMDAGVRVFKIEGRARGPEYVDAVVRCYKEAIQYVVDRGQLTVDSGQRTVDSGQLTVDSREFAAKCDEWDERLARVFNRGFWDGYYLGQKLGEWNDAYGSKATEKKVYCAKVIKYFSKLSVAECQVEACEMNVGDRLLFTGPTTGALYVDCDEIRYELKPVSKAEQGWRISIKVPEKVRPNDKVFVMQKTIGDK